MRREADAQKRAQAAARAAEEVRRAAEAHDAQSARSAAEGARREERLQRLQAALMSERDAALDEARSALPSILFSIGPGQHAWSHGPFWPKSQ